LRPIRPNPLIPTLIDILKILQPVNLRFYMNLRLAPSPNAV
jgi:hypothetical protein